MGGLSVVFLIKWIAPGIFNEAHIGQLLNLIAALVVIRTLEAILWAFLRIEERSKLFNVASVSVKAISIGAICALFPFVGTTAQTTFLGTALAELGLIVSITIWLLRRRLLCFTSFDKPLFRASIAFGLPLVVYEFAFILLGTSDRFLVRYFLGANALGFYSVASGLARNANDLLLTPLGLALVPIYMRLWNTEGAEKTSAFLNRALDGFVMASLGMLAAVAASGRDIVILLASAKYDGAERIVPLLLGGLIVYAMHMFVGAGLLLHKRTLRMAALLVVSVAANVPLNFILVPRVGLLGGALATLLSYSLCIAMLFQAAKKLLPVSLNAKALLKYAILAIVAWLVASRVDIASPILGLLVKTSIVFGIYGGMLYCVDQRVRGGTAWAMERVREVIG
jgi:O-antigen/teichoic acid export membrane protein